MEVSASRVVLVGNNLVICNNHLGVLHAGQLAGMQLDKFTSECADIVQAGWFGGCLTRICTVDNEKLHILTHVVPASTTRPASTASTTRPASTNGTARPASTNVTASTNGTTGVAGSASLANSASSASRGIDARLVADNIYAACWVSRDVVCCLTCDSVLLMLPVPIDPADQTDQPNLTDRPDWPSFDVDDDTTDVCCALGRTVAYLNQSPNVERIDFRTSKRPTFFMSAFDDLACTLRHLVVLANNKVLVCDLDVPDVHYVGAQLEVPSQCSLSRRGDIFESKKDFEFNCWMNRIVYFGWQVDLSVMH